jgi:outer membrane lipoprotein carrier protein
VASTGRFSVGLFAAVLAACLLAAPAVAAAEAGDIARVQRYVDRLSSLRAEFRQQVLDSSGTVRDEAEGTLLLQKPGRFRWEYRSPSEQLLVSDGSTVWLYDVELEQVTVRDVGQSLSTTPAMLLSGQGTVSESFTAADGGGAGGLDWVDLAPKLDDTDFRQVRLGFSGRELVRMELVDRLGQTTRIQFRDIERNPKLTPDAFTFVPPAGVDVVGSAAAR